MSDASPTSPSGPTPSERLRSAATALSAFERTRELEALSALVKSGEFRDWPFDAELYRSLFDLLAASSSAWRSGGTETQSFVLMSQHVIWAFFRSPEFEADVAACELCDEHLWKFTSRSDGSAAQEEWPFIRDIFLWLYEKFPSRRSQIRGLIGRPLRSAAQMVHKASPVAPLLQVLGPIIRGFQVPLSQVHRRVVTDVLLPLHRPNDWLQWDRQTPIISMYHKELVHCLLLFLEKDSSLAPICLEALCGYFPQLHESNTPKEVLLIHEIAEVLKFIDAASFEHVLPSLLRHMIRLIGSHNAQPIQSTLQFWKDDRVANLLGSASSKIIPALLPVLLRGGEPFWNPTVNRMTSLVLEKLEKSNPEVFIEVAEELWGPGKQRPAFEVPQLPPPISEPREDVGRAPLPPQNLASLRFNAGDWKPGNSGGKQPPLTATGVAPWAFKSGGASSSSFGRSKAEEAISRAPVPASGSSTSPPEVVERSGIERVHAYCKILCPVDSTRAGDGPSWEAALMAETPTLLPTLKFHQLVFGADDLGEGAFSVVRYARTIQKDKTQSQWPEYAVKVINTKTMEELGYEASVNREICVLKMLSHPGIARMVSAFRWRDGAYLVLEYANRGDLHTMLVSQGKLEEDVVRFLVGEVIAALTAMHDIGFVYGDLKPENIVITSSCHAKLTDFGGCRPVTDEARSRTRESLLKRLRDGDWRAPDAPEPNPEEQLEAIVDEVESDHRVEGTTMYLPPEVVRGGAPTFAADAWALGCLLYQLLSGRPPVWVESESEEELRSRIVSFQLGEGPDEVFAALGLGARALALGLLEADLEKRLSISEAATHNYFEDLDVYSLYKRPRGPVLPEVHRKAAAGGDERWQKRQFSKIWTVMPSPQDFVPPQSFGTAHHTATVIPETDAERHHPFIGEGLGGGVENLSSSRVESI